MKNIFKKVFGFCAALVMAFGLASCNGVNEKTAEKINVAAAKNDHWTYEEVIEKLGEPQSNTVKDYGDIMSGLVEGQTGTVVYYVGATSFEDALEKVEAGETVKVLTIKIKDGKATEATYDVWENAEDAE